MPGIPAGGSEKDKIIELVSSPNRWDRICGKGVMEDSED